MSEVVREFPAKLAALFQPARYKVLHGGRGGMKSWNIARALLARGSKTPTRILCCREVQKSIKDSVHQLMSDQISALGLGSLWTVTDHEIRCTNKSQIGFCGLSTHTVESIKSYEGVDVCWVEEAHSVSRRSWNVLTPTIRKPGSEIWMSLNPDLDTDYTWMAFVERPPEGAIVIPVGWRDNPWFTPELEAERVRCRQIDPEGYKNIWDGHPRSVAEGAIYTDEILGMVRDKRIRDVAYDPLLRVHTVWDLGWADSMTIIMCQRMAGEIRIIDYIEESHKTYAEYAAMLQDRRYIWGSHWLPHDGASRDAKTGKSAQEILGQLLTAPVQVIPRGDIEEGIKAARMMFPTTYIDQTKAARLIECLKRYKRDINRHGEPGGPTHDQWSHGADALRGLAMIKERLTNDSTNANITQRSRHWIT